jgi:chromosome segregation ATPase
MAEVSSDLILEILKALQRDSGEVKSNIGDIKAELNAIRGHLISLQQDVHNVYGILGRHDLHLERIERRLELNDAPAA